MRFTLPSPGTVPYVNRRLTALLVAPLLTVVLSSCAAVDGVVEQFGPRPNDAVLELAQQARADAERLRALLAEEHAAVYALDIAQAYLDDSGDARAADLIDAHEQRITVLTQTLDPTGEVPVAAPGYAFDGVAAPTDQTEAGQFVNRIAETTDLTWRNAAADAGSLATREWLVRLAGHAAKAAQLHAF